MRAWPRLAHWLREEREFLVFKGDVERAERRWQKEGRKDEALLTGFDLASGEKWLPTREQDLSSDVTDFIKRSISHARAELARALENKSRLLGTLSVLRRRKAYSSTVSSWLWPAGPVPRPIHVHVCRISSMP